MEDCDCRESGQSAVQREAGGPGLRPIHCALIKYNRFNPHNSTVCYQKQLQAWCVPASPRWAALNAQESRTDEETQNTDSLTGCGNTVKSKIPFCFFSVERLFISRATTKAGALVGLTVDDLNWEKAAQARVLVAFHDFHEQKLI